MRRSDYADLAAFVAVVETRSFRKAAAQLGVTPSALSHAIRGLEERLDVRLLNRTTRSVAPTEAGQRILERVGPALTDIRAVVEEIGDGRGEPAGTVRINLPKLAAELVFDKAFGAFGRAHPRVRLELTIDDELADIVREGFDAGVRPGELVHRDMVAMRLTPDLPLTVVGSPAYFAKHPPPRAPRDLGEHRCVAYRLTRSGRVFEWQFEKRGKTVSVDPSPVFTVNDVDLMLAAALDGAGLICTLAHHVERYVAKGRLVPVLEDWRHVAPGFFLYHPSRARMPPALRALVDFLRARHASVGPNPSRRAGGQDRSTA